MRETILQNLFKKKTVERLGQTARKFVAGVTIIMSVFYGTLYYALITLASEDDLVPEPLVNQEFDPQKEPEKFFLESLAERGSSKIKNTASVSNENHQELELGGKKVFEPAAVRIKNKLYVPFRLIVASGSNNLEVELKSKKGTQKIVLQDGGFDYAIFEKQKKNFTKLADIKNIFQFSEVTNEATPIPAPTSEIPASAPEPTVTEAPLITVEPPPVELPTPVFSPEPVISPVENPTPLPSEIPTPSPEIAPENTPPIPPETAPELTPSPQSFFQKLFNTANAAADTTDAATQNWQDIIFSSPVSASWAIDGQLLTIYQENEFYLGTASFSAWAKIKLGYEDSSRVNSWEYGVSRSDGLNLGDYTFRLKYDAALATGIKAKNEEDGELELTVEKDEDGPSKEISDVESEISETEESQANEPSEMPNGLPLILEEEGIVPSQSPAPAEVEPPVQPPTSDATAQTEDETPAPAPRFTITPTPAEPTPEVAPEVTESPVIPESTTQPESTSIPEMTITPEQTPAPESTTTPSPEKQPTSLNYFLNELLDIEIVYADELPPTDTATQEVEPPSLEVQPQNSNLEAQPLSEDVEPQVETQNAETSDLEAELPSGEGQGVVTEESTTETTVSPEISGEQMSDPLVEGIGDVVDTITDGVSSFINNSSISAPVISGPEAQNLEAELPSEATDLLVEKADLSEPPLPPQPLTAQIIDAISVLNPLPRAETFDFKLNFNFGSVNADNIVLDEQTGRLSALLELNMPTSDVSNLSTTSDVVDAQTESLSTSQVDGVALTVISDIGVAVYDDGVWVASGDGSKSTDFKIHFNPAYGGAVDELYLGNDFATNKVAKPQAGSGGLTLIEQDSFSQAETKSLTLEILERSRVRVVVRNIFVLGNGNSEGREAAIEERWTIYATGRIIKQVIYDKLKTGEERWYLNAAKSGFDMPTGYNGTQLMLNTKVEPNSKDLMLVWQDPGSMASATFETNADSTMTVIADCNDGHCSQDDSWITAVKTTRKPWTYTEYQMIDLMQEDLSMIDKTMITERAADYRQPDKPEFSIGSFIGVDEELFSYEMRSPEQKNRVVFTMDGSQVPRFQPVFEIHNWLNPDLGVIRSWLNDRDMIENRDYIVDFVNSDSSTGILIFHFLGTIRTNSEFSADGFATFDIDPEVNPGTGILIYSDAVGGTPEINASTITTDGTGNIFGAYASITTGTVSPIWVVEAASPIGSSSVSDWENEHLVANLNSAGKLEVLRWNGTTWTLEWTENLIETAIDTRAVDVVYEQSGEAIVVWSEGTTTNEIAYRVWNGRSWTASAAFDPSVTSSAVSWIELDSHPASGSNQNEIGLVYVTKVAATGVGAAVWDGATNTWGNPKLVESDGEADNAAGDSKSASIFYEQGSGQLVVAAGIQHGGNNNSVGIVYTTWDPSAGWAATAGFNILSATGSDGAEVLNCSPMPYISGVTNNVAVCANWDNDVADADGFRWSGSNFTNGQSLTATSTASPTSGQEPIPVSVMWLVDGTNRVGLVAYGEADAGLDFRGWDEGGGAWLAAGSQATPTTGTDRNNASFSNPYLKSTGIILLTDINNDLFAYEASLSGTTVTVTGITSNGNPVTLDLASGLGMPAAVAFSVFPNPTLTHYQWVNDDSATVAGATSAASEDTQLTGLAQSSVKVLRVEVSNEGPATKSYNLQLEFAKKGTSCADNGLSPGWEYREIHTEPVTASDAFDIENAQWTNGDATADNDTVTLTNSDTTFVAGQAIDTQSSTSAITLNGNQFTEVAFALQRNSNAQASTNYCFRLTDGGVSTSFSYDVFGEVQTGGAVVSVPTYTQDYFRFYANNSLITPTDPWPSGSSDLAENATVSAHFGAIGASDIARLRTNVLVSTATLNAASQTFQLQYAEGFKCGAIAGGSWAAVGASTSGDIWRFGSITALTDGTALPDSGTLLSNSTNAARATYEEGNPSAVNPNAVTAGQRMEHDWSLQNNGAVSGASYCFRIIRPSGTVFETYNYFPLVVLAPSTDQVLRHGAFFSEGYEQGYYWSGL